MGAATSRIAALLAAVVVAGLLASLDGAAAAEKRLTWFDGCNESIGFDPARYDEVKLRSTLRLLFGPSDFEVPPSPTPMVPQAVARLPDVNRITATCSQALDAANRLEFIPLDGIEDYRRARITELQDVCRFETAKIRGFRDPSALRDYSPALAACSGFIDALEGKRDLLATFRDTVNQSCSRNGSPVSCMARETANLQKPDGMDWAKLYLLVFGWNNCALKYTVRSVDRKRLEQMRAQLEAQFRRLFEVRKDKCDDTGQDGHPEFGSFAMINTDISPAREWTITNLGLFCGSAKFHPGRIMVYVYGIDYQRLATGRPLGATLDIDGTSTELLLQPYDDVALAPVDAGLVRNLLRAHTASVRFKDYKSGRPDALKLDGAGPTIRSALKACFRS